MERIQIDLIDMKHCPDGDFHYMGHFVDHMTKFNILFPLRDKSADEVGRKEPDSPESRHESIRKSS